MQTRRSAGRPFFEAKYRLLPNPKLTIVEGLTPEFRHAQTSRVFGFSVSEGSMPFGSHVLLAVSVNNAAKALVPTTFIRLTREWVIGNTCMQLLERLLRENGHASIADQLGVSEVQMSCARSIGVQAPLANKRSRQQDIIVATTFLEDILGEALDVMQSDELSFAITTPLPNRLTHVDATATLLRAASSNLHLPPRKNFSRMTGVDELYNAVLDYLGTQGVGWTHDQLPTGKLFVDHICKAFFVLTPKVCQMFLFRCSL
jgi:hypothetical protein